MPKPRNHRAAYARRKASALARGFTVAQGRGHPGRGQAHIRGPPPSPQEIRKRLEEAVKAYRKLGRQDSAAKAAQVSRQRFRSFLHENDLLVRDGRRWAIVDLRKMLAYRMGHLNLTERSALFDFTRPLGAFSAMIDVAYAFDVIDRDDRDDLHIIREMRNACAHSPWPISFETPVLAQATGALKGGADWLTSDVSDRTEARALFQLTCGYFSFRSELDRDEADAKMRELIVETLDELGVSVTTSPDLPT
jgi:hypothetical protein